MANIADFNTKPLVIGKVYGLRSFRPTETGEIKPISMGAVQTGFVWQEGENHSLCTSGKHTPAVKDCFCGFYAFTNPNNTEHVPYSYVQGIIEAWGRLVIGTKGFRAEKAKIVVLVEPNINELVNPTVAMRFNKVRRKIKDIPIVPSVDIALAEFPITPLDPRDYIWSGKYA